MCPVETTNSELNIQMKVSRRDTNSKFSNFFLSTEQCLPVVGSENCFQDSIYNLDIPETISIW